MSPESARTHRPAARRPIHADDVCRHRMRAQHLVRPYGGSVADLVRALGAVQAQDYPGAKWALGMRLRGATDAAIESEFAAGRILRTHVLRPTWHFVAPEDIRWMLGLTAPRVAAVMASYNRTLELTPAVFARSNDAIARALEGGRQATRAELKVVLERAGVTTTPVQRLARLMMQAELDRVVCSGARAGSQFTYALLDERVPAATERDRDEALRDLAVRYFTMRGPASAPDFSWWSGLTIADARRGAGLAGKDLEHIEVGGRAHWMASDAPRPRRTKPMAHLLPNYDEYFIGLKDRSAIGQRVGHVELATGGDFLVAHIAFIDGQIVGGWRRVVEKGGGITIALRAITRVTSDERTLLQAEAQRLSRFLGVPAQLRFIR